MEELLSFQNNILKSVKDDLHRYLFAELKEETRFLGIKGLRGVGKTTMFLQFLKYHYPEKQKALYVTADHPYFYSSSLLDLAAEWYSYGGKLLMIDEVHKYTNWSRELKLIYDGHPGMSTFFTSSSVLNLYKGESDLSRRLISKTLNGLSFREYLLFFHGIEFGKTDLETILHSHTDFSNSVTEKVKILPLFKEYLKEGYFPFKKELKKESVAPALVKVLNTVLESDLSFVEGYNAGNIEKIRKLLGVISDRAPFTPNISKIAEKLGLGRNTVNIYLKNLRDARILNFLNKPGKGISQLQKPDKIYFENTNFAYAIQANPNIGTLRETFFMNQLLNAGNKVNLSTQNGDFLVNEKYVFEIGGKNKKSGQIKNLKNAFLVMDDIENGFGNRIPLWVFGFLY